MDKSEHILTPHQQVLGERLVDQVREMQVSQWGKGLWTPVEQLCSNHFAALSLSEDDFLELIVAEYDLRKRLGDRPVVAGYIERFPKFKDRLPSLLALADQLETNFEPKQSPSVVAVRPDDLSEQSSQESLNQELYETKASEQTSTRPASRFGSKVAMVPECGMKVGKYRLVEKLGQGGMGTVFRASHSLIDHHVALKLMLPDLVGHPNLQKRFLKEAQVCVGLHHPNLVRTFDIDEHDDCLYMTMELLKGCHLGERVNQSGPMNSLETANIVRQVAEGLAYAHSRGIIHRDVKPQNLMLTDDDQVKVLDLGLAKLLGNFDGEASSGNSDGAANDWRKKLEKPSDDLVTHDGRLTYVGSILGTIGYMSREQAINPGVADVRNDVFSLGCTAYFLLTSRSIHGSRSASEILGRLISDAEWSDFPLEGICEQWRKLLGKMLARKAKDRLESMQHVMDAIDAAFELGRSWKPDPDDLSQLKRKLLELQVVSEDQWDFAEDRKDASRDSFTTLSLGRNRESSREPTPALQFLFGLTETFYPPTSEFILTQYQVQLILAGKARTLRQGKHLICDSMNRGWKGEVFLARDTEFNRQETLRMLPIEQLRGLASETDFESAVKQIGASLERLEHPNLAKTYRFEQRGNWLLIASEYLRGDSLRKAVQNSHPNNTWMNPFMPTTAIELACGVQYLHEQGCLHLDLSPDRWIKRQSGQWCLLDAGWANLLMSKQWKDMPGSAGLPPVLSPELMQDLQNVGTLSDIFALGQVFRFLMTGDFPFQSLKLSEMDRTNLPFSPLSKSSVLPSRAKESRKSPQSINSWSKGVARDWRVEWNQLVDSMTSVDMSARPQTAAKVVQQLSQIVELTKAENPGESAIGENSNQQKKHQLSFSQRLRRMFGQDH